MLPKELRSGNCNSSFQFRTFCVLSNTLLIHTSVCLIICCYCVNVLSIHLPPFKNKQIYSFIYYNLNCNYCSQWKNSIYSLVCCNFSLNTFIVLHFKKKKVPADFCIICFRIVAASLATILKCIYFALQLMRSWQFNNDSRENL